MTHAPTGGRLALTVFALGLALGPPLRAQRPRPVAAVAHHASISVPAAGRPVPHPRRTVVRASKWALLGATVGFGAYAIRHTARAQEHYDALIAACTTSPARCDLADGRYPDAGIERLYQRTLAQDRRARIGIVGGQATLLGSLALFIYDLRNGRGPSDIPYPGSGAAARAASPGVAAGFRLAF